MPEKSRWREALLYGVSTSPMVEGTTAFRADERMELMSPYDCLSNPEATKLAMMFVMKNVMNNLTLAAPPKNR